MSKAEQELAFWNKILSTAEHLDEYSDTDGLHECRRQLDTLIEAFASNCDPVEHYEPYVLMRLIKSIQKQLEANS
ncbi:MAG: hypothetical protein R3332_01500 [Pseudohongiellaceae bacterium]|nr:hypothetical protein [Pseudohongiellaceae bacterium]